MSLVIYGDPHGEWRPLLAAVAKETPTAVVILGDCDLVRPIHVELAPVFAAELDVRFLYGNHDRDFAQFWDNLVGNHPAGLLHARVARLGPFSVAGIAGVFKQRIWLPPDPPVFRSRAAFVRQLSHHERWRRGVPLKHCDGIFPEDFLALANVRADILVTHEAPSSHRYGFAALDDLARDEGVRLVVHGHHHENCIGMTRDGIMVIGLAGAEALLLSKGDLP